MGSKYDTNPLDPDFPQKARAAVASADQSRSSGSETRPFAGADGEERTRRFTGGYAPPVNADFSMGYAAPTAYSPAETGKFRRVDKIGIRENIATAIPYIPWYFGMIAAVLMLLFLGREESKVRFHAAQGLAAHIGILLITTVLGMLGRVTGFAEAGNIIFQLAATIMLIVFVVKAWKGRPIHIEAIDGLTNWLDEKLSPKTIGK